MRGLNSFVLAFELGPHSVTALTFESCMSWIPVLSDLTWHYRGQLIKAPAEKLTATSRSSRRDGEGEGR